MSLYRPIPISLLLFLSFSLFLSFFSPESLNGLMPTKVNRLVLLNSEYPRLKLSMFFGALFSTVIMIPYLIWLSIRLSGRQGFSSKGNSYQSFVGFLFFLIGGLNSFLFYGVNSYLGQVVVHNPFAYFIFCVAPIILYQIPFRYFARS